MTLIQMKPKEIAKIKSINAKGRLLQRLYEMGFIQGQKVEFIRASPLNDPIEVKILSNSVVLRKNEAKDIEVIYE